MLFLILIGVQYPQNAIFALGKVRIVKITAHVLTTLQKNSPPRIHPPPLTAIWKTLYSALGKKPKLV